MLKIKKNVPLAQYTNYKIGGPARYFCEIPTQIRPKGQAFRASADGNADLHRFYKELAEMLEWARKKRVPVFILGGGTNVLVSDEGFKGLVIRMDNAQIYADENADRTQRGTQINTNRNTNKRRSISVNLRSNLREFVHVKVGAGTLLSEVVRFSIDNGLTGLEWAAGIPGTIGGAIRGNAGAFGHNMGSIVELATVLMFNDVNNVITLSNKEMQFGYRTSVIKKRGNMIILSATLKLRRVKNKKEKIKNRELINYYLNYRKEHQPLEYPSCGSTFKNAEITPEKAAEITLKGIDAEQRRNIQEILQSLALPQNKNKTSYFELISEEHSVLRSQQAGKHRVLKRAKSAKNLVIPAAKLIAKAGLAGKRIGGAQISEKHSNFIINLGQAKAKDVYGLIKLCQKEVYQKFGVKLETEVEMVGFYNTQMNADGKANYADSSYADRNADGNADGRR